MINENKCIDFKSIQIPFPLWQRLGRVASNTGITRNLILRMGFCYRIEQVKGLSEDRAVNQADTKTISKDVLFADYSELFFDLFFDKVFYSNFIRIAIVLNLTWCINSFAHYFGDKPHNKNLKASNNSLLGFLLLGEGWHNYHHSYPKDYRASEPNKINFTTNFIDLTKILGLSYNHFYNNNNKIPINEKFNKNFYTHS